MKKKMINRTFIQGMLYQHSLEKKVVNNPESANNGVEYITGNIEIATDDKKVNIVTVHFSFVTATTKSQKPNATFNTLSDIISGKYGSIVTDGEDKAICLTVDSAVGLNEFYSDRNGTDELVSVKRNEGGFVHVTSTINEDEKTRNTFETDIIITNVRHVDADDEKGYPEKAIIKGEIFDFRNAILPVEFTVLNPNAIAYFEGLEASSKAPVFTKIRGRQISETIVRKIEEESAFGETFVREVPSSRKDFVVTWAQQTPYEWDSEDSILASEFAELITARNTYLATLKKRQDEYKASKGQGSTSNSGFDF